MPLRQNIRIRTCASVCAILAATLLLSSFFCGACSDARQAAGNGQSYEEITIPLPQEVTRVLFADCAGDAPVTVIGASLDNSSIGVWELQHDNSWTQKLDAAKILNLSTDDFINCASIAPNGSLFFGVQSYYEGESMRLYIIDAEEAVDVKDFRLPLSDTTELLSSSPDQSAQEDVTNEANPQEEMSSLSFHPMKLMFTGSEESVLAAQEYRNQFFVLNLLEESVQKVSIEGLGGADQIMSAITINDTLMCLAQTELSGSYSLALHSIDLVTYESVEVDPKLQDEIQKLSFTADSNFYVPPTLFVDHYNPGGFGLYTQSGIYRATDSTLVEIAHAQDTRIADPSKSISECVFINESDFLLVAGDRNNYLSGLALYKYVLGSDVSDATGEIKVYSLKDSADLRYAVTLFKDKYPNVAVTVDIGLSGNLTSVEDAIRSLNIELLSQEGPDVIFLDGLPIESFIKQGILHDVSDIHERLTLSNLYYQAIIDTFLEEGSCYALPARFGLPIVFGSEEMVSSVDSLSDLVEVAKLYSERPGSFLAAPLERTLLLASYNSCFVDGNVDAVGLRSYYECIFEIHSILLDSKVSYPYLGEDFSHVDSEIAGVIEHLLDGSNSFLVALLNEEWDCGITFELSKGYNDAPMEAALLTLGEDNTFIPCATVGIRQSTEDLDLSKEFVEIMFSGDFQEINQRTGLSIMKEIIVSEFTLEGVGLVLIDTNENYYVDEIPEENVAAYKEMFASLNSPVIVDSFIESIVLKQTQLLLSGEITIDDAVDETIKRVSLYLVE